MRKCPTCSKPVEWQHNPWRPFCSERCKLIDFDKWTNEEYRVPDVSVGPAELKQHSESAGDTDEQKESD